MKRKKEELLSERIQKQLPNWSLSALYNDRQLIRDGKMTKYFVPFDTVQPDKGWKLFLFREDNETEFSLDTESIIIGREGFCNIILKDKDISRQHCVIQFRMIIKNGKQCSIPYLFDLGSKHGTHLNGEMIRSKCFVELKSRDIITIGELDKLVIMYNNAPFTFDEEPSILDNNPQL